MKKEQRYFFKYLACFTLLTVLSYPSLVSAQIEDFNDNEGATGSMRFDTRSLSMGSATIADYFGRASIGLNPALSGLYQNMNTVQFNTYHNWDNNLMQYDMMLPTVFVGPHHVTARVGFVHSGYDQINYLGSASIPEPDLMVYRADIAYALKLSEVFSAGMMHSISHTFSDEDQKWTYFADLGIVYAPEGPVSYGIVLQGIGRESNYEIIEDDGTLISPDSLNQTFISTDLMRQSLEIGATLRYPVRDRTQVTISFANEKRFGESGLWYKAGIEVLPYSFIALRSGFMFQLDQSIFLPRYGLGFSSKYARLDYMIAPKNLRGEYFHQIGLTIQF